MSTTGQYMRRAELRQADHLDGPPSYATPIVTIVCRTLPRVRVRRFGQFSFPHGQVSFAVWNCVTPRVAAMMATGMSPLGARAWRPAELPKETWCRRAARTTLMRMPWTTNHPC